MEETYLKINLINKQKIFSDYILFNTNIFLIIVKVIPL